MLVAGLRVLSCRAGSYKVFREEDGGGGRVGSACMLCLYQGVGEL